MNKEKKMKLLKAIANFAFFILGALKKISVIQILTVMLYISTILSILVMLGVLQELRIFELATYNIEINGYPTAYASYILGAYIAIILVIPILRICMRNMHKYLHYICISINLLISNFTLFSLPKFIKTIKDLEMAQADTIAIGRWITIRKIWSNEEIMKVMNTELDMLANEVNYTLSEEDRATMLDTISKRKNIHSMEEARQILNSCIQKYMKKTEAKNTPSNTTWSQWVYEYKIYFTSEYYYVGWFIATAVILGTGYCIYTLLNNSGGGSGKPDGGSGGSSGGSGKPGGSSGGSSGGSGRPSGGSGGSNNFDAPSVTDSMQNTISYTVPYQDAASAAAVASILNNIQTKQTDNNTINDQNTTIAKKAGAFVKYKYEGEMPTAVKPPSFGVDGMMATMMQTYTSVAQKSIDRIRTLKEKLDDIILEQLLALQKTKNAVYEDRALLSSKLKDGVSISGEGIDALLRLTTEDNINAITRIADTEAAKKTQQQKIKEAIADAMIVEKNKSKNEYSTFESKGEQIERDIWTKGINKLIEIQEEAIKFIIDILK